MVPENGGTFSPQEPLPLEEKLAQAKANAAVKARQLAQAIQQEQLANQQAQLQKQQTAVEQPDREAILRAELRRRFAHGQGAIEQTRPRFEGAAGQAQTPAPHKKQGETVHGEPAWGLCRAVGILLLAAGFWLCISVFFEGLAELLPFLPNLSLAMVGWVPFGMLFQFFASALTFTGADLLLQLPEEQHTPVVTALLPLQVVGPPLGALLHVLGLVLAALTGRFVILTLLVVLLLAALNLLLYNYLRRALYQYFLHQNKP